jgi:hypothetical protein
MSVTPKTYDLEYVYGPLVGRRQIEAYTIEKAADKLWAEFERILWVDKRFRHVKEIKHEQ